MRPVRREGSGRGVVVTTQMPALRNKRMRKVVEKWEPLVKAPKRYRRSEKWWK
jgi:hypothetical protein